MKLSVKFNIRTIHEGIIIFLALAISFLLPIYKQFIPLLMAAWLLFAISRPRLMRTIRINYSFKEMSLILIQIVFFLVVCIGILISNSKDNAREIAFMKLSFLMMPVLFLLSVDKLIKYKDLIIKFFIIGNLTASVICIVYAFIQSFHVIDGNLFFYNFDIENRNLFRYSAFSIFLHPSYFSMYLLLSMSALIFLKKKQDRQILRLGQLVYYVILIFHLVVIWLLSSRTGMIIAIILIIRELYLNFKKEKRKFFKIMLLFLIIFSFLIFITNDRFKKALSDIQQSYKEGSSNRNFPVRLLLWDSAIELIKENFWLGIGTGDVKQEFAEKNKAYLDRDAKMVVYNAHNQFLDTFMSSGILGIIVLLSLFIAAVIQGIKSKNQFFIIFLTIVFINFLFESMLNTMAGIIFFTFFFNYFVFLYKENKSDQCIPVF